MRERLRSEAEAVLKSNDRGGYTVPSVKLYPHQWAWDSGFAAIGWARIDPERAAEEIEKLLAGQWQDGRIPHIHFHRPTPDYFPGPESWGFAKSSTISNPPVWTLAAHALWEQGFEPTRIRSWLPSLERSHDFLLAHRDPLNWDSIITCHPWENGQDNCPAWDVPLEAVDPREAPDFKRVDKERVADASQRPTDDQYKRYMVLVDRMSRNGFHPANFQVYDPFFTTLVALAEKALAEMADGLAWETQARERAQRLAVGLERLWSPEHKRYRYYDALTEEFLAPETIGAYAPLLLGDKQLGFHDLKEGLEDFWKVAHPLPTVKPGSESYDSVCYWRGPTWVNINWLFSAHYGARLIEPTLALVETQGFWEYFDPSTGEGLGTDGFTWTAALTLDLLARA